MQITVTITDRNKRATAPARAAKPNRGGLPAAPPPYLNPRNPFLRGYKYLTETARHRSFCGLCNREGYIASLFSNQKTPCPACLGSKFTDHTETPLTRLAGVITYLRAVRLLEFQNLIFFVGLLFA